jgi:pimeloyl-ACP methyl ester carboxylesterase
MDRLGIGRAIIVGHSFGAAVATAFALDFPDRTAGLICLAAATHPWPGGATSWYYRLAAVPAVGWLFTETISAPAGGLRMAQATDCVFAPNPTPENYLARASIGLVLRPAAFRANAADVESLYPYVTANSPRYRRIAAPAVVISGDRDTVVYEEIHSAGLARDLPHAELIWVRNLGHKPDWIAPDLVVAAIEKISGRIVDLKAAVAKVEARIAGDRQGEGVCVDLKAPAVKIAPRGPLPG